jgi:hypothetical protein
VKTVMSQWCYSGVAVILQSCYVFTVSIYCFHKAGTENRAGGEVGERERRGEITSKYIVCILLFPFPLWMLFSIDRNWTDWTDRI